jgi:hypothetical protein
VFGWRRTITEDLAGFYSERLLGGALLAKIASAHKNKSAPRLFIMTTNLTMHTSQSYFDMDQFVYDAMLKPVKISGFPVGDAVAASSAFPFLFPPVKFAEFDPKISVPQFKLNAVSHYLTDGGVFENLGVSILRSFATHTRASCGDGERDEPPPQIVVSDAGSRVDWDLENRSSRGWLRTLLRSSEISQYWAEQRVRAAAKVGEIFVKIDDEVTSEKGRKVASIDLCVGNEPSG